MDASATSTGVTDLVKSINNKTLFPLARGRVITIVVQLAEGNGAEYDGGSLNVLTGEFEEPGITWTAIKIKGHPTFFFYPSKRFLLFPECFLPPPHPNCKPICSCFSTSFYQRIYVLDN